jgi:hypothetical protein
MAMNALRPLGVPRRNCSNLSQPANGPVLLFVSFLLQLVALVLARPSDKN